MNESKSLAPLKAIHQKCLDCSGFQPKEVKLCPGVITFYQKPIKLELVGNYFLFVFNKEPAEKIFKKREMVSNLRSSKKIKRKHKEKLESIRNNLKTQIEIILLNFLTNIWAFLISQYILSLWKK